MTNAAPSLDYKRLVPATTPFPLGKAELRIPPEVLELAEITSKKTDEQLPPAQVRRLQKALSDAQIDSCVNASFQSRPIPSRVFLDGNGGSFSIPQEGAFMMRVEGRV